jgi:hypothetical protein
VKALMNTPKLIRVHKRSTEPAGPLEWAVRNIAIIGSLLFAGHVLWPLFSDQPPPTAGLVAQAEASVMQVVDPQPLVDQHFRGCGEARAAGREDIPRSDPSYREWMDGDGDGLACEPHW